MIIAIVSAGIHLWPVLKQKSPSASNGLNPPLDALCCVDDAGDVGRERPIPLTQEPPPALPANEISFAALSGSEHSKVRTT